MRRAVNLGVFAGAALAAFLVATWFPHPSSEKLFYTLVALVISYGFFRAIVEPLVGRRLKDNKARYGFRKSIAIVCWTVFGIVTLRIWIINPQALLVAYGLVGAGVAVALQDLFRNFVGGIIIYVTNVYRAGDRVEINHEYGDVIDVGLMYTTFMEIKEWVGGDQATGRLCVIPNGHILSYTIHNYTKEHSFIWDELMIPITYDSDFVRARECITRVLKEETEKLSGDAVRQMAHMEQKYYFSRREVEPMVFLTLTDNWVQLNVRYITSVRERRFMHNAVSEGILKALRKEKKVKIASQTVSVVGFPDVRLKK